ncbi:hypothetical protein [Mariniblastus fucicola]|uniref:Uncharacterized protein n=1 Tax=Mariniblastus fucicola TaxID=980251 RepID=A0A5B9PS92_9BACT|nr:hypothetical protein [Mariniblastus fucicola]QEG25093.1 hypothetical protein MFFC18_50160 [Mariniblastus fucicola]
MKYRYIFTGLTQAGILTAVVASVAFAFASPAPGQNQEPDAPRIAWYATLESGLAEAERSNRPILFTSAAPQCLGVSGIW